MKEIKEIKATGEHVVLKMHVKEKEEPYKLKGGIYVPNEDTQNTGNGQIELEYAEVYDIGSKAKAEADFQIGDRVIFNEYDIKYVGSKERMFGITKASSIMSVYEPEEEN